ncbi:MAG: hypothetical protein Kow0032_13920 [Methyloligellaceae bacterium]
MNRRSAAYDFAMMWIAAPARRAAALGRRLLWGGCVLMVAASLVFPYPVQANDDSSATVRQKARMAQKFGRPGPVYDLAVRFSRKGAFEEARILLLALKRPDHPLVLNQLGYATRKAGRPQEAIAYYEAALKLDPGFLQARQYLGEAWLQLDKPDRASKELAALDALCGQCKDYRDLERAIRAYTDGAPAPSSGW